MKTPKKLSLVKLDWVCDGHANWYKGFAVVNLGYNNYSILIPYCFGKDIHGFLPSCEWIEDYISEQDETETKYPSYHTDDIPYKIPCYKLKLLSKIKYFKNKQEPYYE